MRIDMYKQLFHLADRKIICPIRTKKNYNKSIFLALPIDFFANYLFNSTLNILSFFKIMSNI